MKTPTKLAGVRPVKSIVRPRSWAIYGRSGSGKTTFASTFPKPILLLDVRDQGTDSIMDHDQLNVKDIESLEELEETYYYLLKYNTEGYKTVIIDTITQLQQVFMEEVTAGKRKNSAVGDWGSMTRREFGDVAALMKEWIHNFRNLTAEGMEIVFIAQERTSVQEEDGTDNMITPEVGPATMPSVAMHLNANVSIIGNSFIRLRKRKVKKNGKEQTIEDTQYCLRVGPSPVYITKIRKPKSIEAPAFVEDPTYKDIIDVIKDR